MKQQGEKIIERKSEKGLTAIELLIAMAVFLIVMASVYGMLRIGNLSRTTVNRRSENIKNVRSAINTIGREAVNAGLGYNRVGGTVPDDFTTLNFGLPPDADGVHDLLTAISAGFNITQSNISSNSAKNDVVAFAFRDFEFNDGFPIVINDVTQSGDKLILKTPNGACANCRPYDLFLLETGEGRQAVILSTDIVNNNSIVLGGGSSDPLNINYGPPAGGAGGASSDDDDDDDDDDDSSGKTQKGEDSNGICLSGHYGHKHCIDPQGLIKGSGSSTSGTVQNSSVKKCGSGVTENCISYGTTSVIAKKIYLVSYSVSSDGMLIRTTLGNNTGGGADDQILSQPIASGVRSFKIKYLLDDGTVTEDPSVANTQKERCNEIIQIEVTATVDTDANTEPITLTSTFSTRNLKYDVY